MLEIQQRKWSFLPATEQVALGLEIQAQPLAGAPQRRIEMRGRERVLRARRISGYARRPRAARRPDSRA